MTLQLVALSPTELQPAQAALLEWCDGRLAHWLAEQTEAREAYQYAVKHRWAPGRFRLSMNKAGRKLGFYRKVRRALELGYLIVPNLPLEFIAIRTDARAPKAEDSRSCWERFEQHPRTLPEGKGRYVSPRPTIAKTTQNDKDGKAVAIYSPDALTDELELPVRLLKPQVLSAIDAARARKLFDALGVCSDRAADPIVCGLIREGGGWSDKRVTFFLAWYFDLEQL